MPALRRLGSRFLSWLTRLTTGYAVDDCQCGFTALCTDTAARLALDDLWPRYGYPNDLLALLRNISATVVEVPVRPVYAGEGSGLHVGHVFTIAGRITETGHRAGIHFPTAAHRCVCARSMTSFGRLAAAS